MFPDKDRISVDQEMVHPTEKLYLMLNKPRGVVTTASDEKGRETVYAYLPSAARWVAPVGRLDKASEGLLLITNDSAWAAKLTDPGSHLDKTYHVQIGAVAGEKLLRAVRTGVRPEDGDWLSVKRVEVLRGAEKNSWLEIVLDEGKNRQIRRIFGALDIEVLRLVRVAIGPVVLGTLKKGEVRQLTAEERKGLSVG
jgi:23S rRNA pseudouridine2605 synthase